MYFYLVYGDNKKCYLSTIKDAETNEILAYYISESMTLDISLEIVKKLHRKKNVILNENVIIHSDQGVHYTSPKFHNLLKNIIFNNLCLEEVIVGIMLHKNLILAI